MPEEEKKKVIPEIDYKKKYEELIDYFSKFVANMEGVGFQIQVLSKNQYKNFN